MGWEWASAAPAFITLHPFLKLLVRIPAIDVPIAGRFALQGVLPFNPRPAARLQNISPFLGTACVLSPAVPARANFS